MTVTMSVKKVVSFHRVPSEIRSAAGALLESVHSSLCRFSGLLSRYLTTRKQNVPSIMVLSLALLIAFPDSLSAADPIPIAVVDFSAASNNKFMKSVPEMVVNEIVNTGRFDVLERKKLDTLVGEIAFQQQSGFVSPQQAVQMGGMLGAQLIVTGHILDFGTDRQTFRGYGISTTKTVSRLQARLEVINVATGAKIFSDVADASVEVQAVQGNRVDTTDRSLSQQVANKLVNSMMESPRITSMVSGPSPVSIAILSDPPEADVEIDGTYYGSAVGNVELLPGMHEVSVSLPGYLTWTKRVLVKEGTKIRARLQPDNTERQESKITIKNE